MNTLPAIINGVLILAGFGMLALAIREQHKSRRAFIEYIKKNRQIGYIQISSDGISHFVPTNPDGSPIEEQKPTENPPVDP